MKAIVTLTMNPALDVSTAVERVVSTHKLRCGPARVDPGGGGVNVARVVHRLGGEARALYAAGGPTGHAYRQLVEAEGVSGVAIAIEGSTRQDFTVDETESGEQYRFVLQGPKLAELEWRRCLEVLAEHVAPGSLVVASGSLPPGVPDDFYGRVARLVREREARCVLDTSGEALRVALAEGVWLVKPNRRELRGLTGAALETPEEQERAARALVEGGQAEIVALTLGADGALLAWSGGALRLPAPEVEMQSAVGAGDSFVGAMVLALARGRALEEAFRYACAAGAAALLTPATELCRREDVERLERELAEEQARPA
jgi:6-phosphofructokinase 2